MNWIKLKLRPNGLSIPDDTCVLDLVATAQLYKTDDPEVDLAACWKLMEEDNYRIIVDHILESQAEVESEKVSMKQDLLKPSKNFSILAIYIIMYVFDETCTHILCEED